MRFARYLLVCTIILAFSPSTLLSQQIAQTQLQTGNRASDKVVSVNFSNTSVEDALKEIVRQSDIVLRYKKSTIPSGARVTFRSERIPAVDAVRVVLKGTGVEMFTEANGAVTLMSGTRNASTRSQGVITGRVTDAKTGRNISGASVSLNPDGRGIVTDENGSYRLINVSSGTHMVVARLVGYAKQTKSVNLGEGATVTVDFKLEASASVLDQVVVTGTMVSTELKAVPNAITVITAKQIEERGITRIDQLFRGEIPGIFAIDQGANATSDEVVMFSRGPIKISNSTAASAITQPIKTYVDGIELADGMYVLSQIDPKSIERIEILTGPQASTIYGANAINGVMQVFTKRGNTIKPSLTLNVAEGFAQNSFNSALSSSHQYGVNMSGTEGRVSYNVGSGWDYTGAWTPGKQSQRTSIYGGNRYQLGVLSVDLSARTTWTNNKQEGSVTQVLTAMGEKGRFAAGSFSGLMAPARISSFSRTTGVTIGYTPFTWWSHQINAGNDLVDNQAVTTGIVFSSISDTALSGNRLRPRSRMSQTYTSTLRFPMFTSANATLTYGLDNWHYRSTAFVDWTVQQSGQLTNASIDRPAAVTSTKNSGAYVQGQFGFWDALFFTYGIRAEWSPVYGANARIRPGKYGVSYAKDIGVVSAKLRGSYGRSIKPPAVDLIKGVQLLPTTPNSISEMELYGSPLYTTLPSPDLGAEFQQGGEGGIELYFGSSSSIVITRYNQTVDRLISTISKIDSVRAFTPGFTSTGPSSCRIALAVRADGYCYIVQNQNLNVGSIRNQGWEMQGSVSLGPITTRGTYTWMKSRVIGITPKYRSLLTGREFTPGQTFNWVPEHNWAMNVSYTRRGTSLLLNVNGLGQSVREVILGDLNQVTSSLIRLRAEESYRMNNPTNYRQAVSGYANANMNVGHRISDVLEATAQITNLTNHYQNDYSYQYPTLGRQTRLGLRWRLN